MHTTHPIIIYTQTVITLETGVTPQVQVVKLKNGDQELNKTEEQLNSHT